MGTSVKTYLPAFLGLFVLAVIVRFISAEYTLNRYLEWAFFAILVGLLVANTVGVPTWLKPAVQTVQYCKLRIVWPWHCLDRYPHRHSVYVVVRYEGAENRQ